MSEEKKRPEGWGFPALSRKFHYFRDAESLCRRWLFTGPVEPDNGKFSPKDDCAPCYRALEKERA